MSGEARESLSQALLLAMDGDTLPGAGRSIGNDGGDVVLAEARPTEVAYWAAEVVAVWVRERLGSAEVREAVASAIQGRQVESSGRADAALAAVVGALGVES